MSKQFISKEETLTEFFNKSSYSITLPERVEKRAKELCPDLEGWNTAKIKTYFLTTFGNDTFNKHWADKLVKEYGYMIWNHVWKANRKELGDKKAEALAIKTVNDFERNFK
jgi:hypothetical protein